MKKEAEQPLRKNEMLVRGLFMLFFIVVYSISKFLIIGIMLFQFVSIMLSEKLNEQILKFSQSLGVYIYQIIQFLSFNSEQRPFPFSKWPESVPLTIHQPGNDKNS